LYSNTKALSGLMSRVTRIAATPLTPLQKSAITTNLRPDPEHFQGTRRLGERIDLDGAAVRGERFAVVGGESDRDKARVRFLAAHPHDAGKA
jgi:hypothetical protein